MTTDELSKSNRAAYIEACCKALGCKVLNICHEVSADDIKSRLRISSNHYKNYVDSYAKANNTPQQEFWEIIENNIVHNINPIKPIKVNTPIFIPWVIGASGFP